VKFLIELTTRPQQIVLDSFLGSGTTVVAAKQLNRQFIGFEIVAAYYQYAQQRLAACEASSPIYRER
jgi:site-specific DNA-methyltransferase (adenine-specific)